MARKNIRVFIDLNSVMSCLRVHLSNSIRIKPRHPFLPQAPKNGSPKPEEWYPQEGRLPFRNAQEFRVLGFLGF